MLCCLALLATRLIVAQEEDYDFDDGVYAELNLEQYVDVDGDNDSIVGSDNEVDGKSRRIVWATF